ncbi:phage tail fiber protein [Enterobacter hormaechei]
MLYNTGTIAINGNTATGTGTNWTAPASQIRVGQTLFVLSNPVQMFQITAINSATSLTVTPAASPALSGQKYGILVTDSLSVDGLAQSMSQLINEYDENIGAWETFATTSANQNITVTINGTRVTIPAIGKLAQKGSNGAIPIGQGGTGATNVADARTNLGLGSSATRDAYSSTGQMLSRGDFGLGGPGNSSAGWDIAIDGRFLSSPYDGPSATAVFMGINCAHSSDSSYCFQLGGRGNQGMWWRARESASFLPWLRVYDTGNTTRASDGTLKAASPVVKLYADGSFETNNESEGCTVTRMKAGEYLIEGCMGMNSDAAWGGIDGGFDIPKDRNGQALIWLDYEVNADGSVLVKTFHREYPSAPIFARNSGKAWMANRLFRRKSVSQCRVEMPQNSIWNQRAAMAEVSD